jgi:hypothetical protein
MCSHLVCPAYIYRLCNGACGNGPCTCYDAKLPLTSCALLNVEAECPSVCIPAVRDMHNALVQLKADGLRVAAEAGWHAGYAASTIESVSEELQLNDTKLQQLTDFEDWWKEWIA